MEGTAIIRDLNPENELFPLIECANKKNRRNNHIVLMTSTIFPVWLYPLIK
jgi:hypothetical protein